MGTSNTSSNLNDRLLTVQEVAEHLSVSPRHIRRLIADGALGSIHIGRSLRIRPAALAAFVDRNARGEAA